MAMEADVVSTPELALADTEINWDRFVLQMTLFFFSSRSLSFRTCFNWRSPYMFVLHFFFFLVFEEVENKIGHA